MVKKPSELQKFNLDIREKKLQLYATWEDLFNIAKLLVDQAKVDPQKVKAGLLQQVVRILSQSGKILKEAEEFKAELEEALEREDAVEDGMTAEERELLEHYNEFSDGFDHPETDNDEAPTVINDDDFKAGFNFRRDS